MQKIEVPGLGIVEFPDGMNDDEIASAISKNAQPQYSTAPDSFASKVNDTLDSVEATPYVGPVVKGVRDFTRGGAQLLAHGINKFAPSVLSDDDLRGVDNDVRTNEQRYQASRTKKAGGETPGIDWGRMVGNGLATAPLLPLKAATLPVAVAKSAGANSALGALQPVTGDGGFWAEKAKGAGIGAGVGAAIPLLGGGVSRIVSPKVSPEVRKLLDEGVTPTPGQILGGRMAGAEEKMSSFPVLGGAIKNGQRAAIEDFNVAAFNRSLKPIGQKFEGKAGREGVLEVKTKLGAAYDELLPKLKFKADEQFSGELNNLGSIIENGNVPPALSQQFNSIVKNDVLSRMTKQGSMDGTSFKELESALSQKIKSFKSSPDPNNQALGDALNEVLSSARSALLRANPMQAPRLTRINEGYANYARIRDAAASVGAPEGVFTPAQLQSAVKKGDKSVGKGNFATGKAFMQDLSEGGKNVLGSKYPDSGTAGRLAAIGLPAGATAMASFMPLTTLATMGALGVGALPYTSFGRKMAANALTKRPEWAKSVASGIKSNATLLGPAVTGGLLSY